MGGTLTLLKSLLSNLSKHFDLYVVVQKDIKGLDLNVTIFRLQTSNTLLSIFRLRTLCKKHRFMCVFSFMERANLISYIANLYLPCHSVLSVHNSPQQAFKHRTMLKRLASDFLYRSIKKQSPIVAVSEGISNELRKTYRLKNVTTIYNSIAKVTGVQNSDYQSPVLLTHCRLVRQKRLDILIDSVHKLRQKHQNFKLVIVGDGPLKAELNNKIDDLNCVNYVKVESNLNPDLVLKGSHIYLQSSKFEGFGIAMLEAMSFGLAVVAVDCDYGPREILKSKYGILVNDGQRSQIVDDLNNVLSKLLSDYKQIEKWRYLALEGADYFTSDKIIQKYIKLFNDLSK